MSKLPKNFYNNVDVHKMGIDDILDVTSEVDALQTTVGDADSGLVKQVNDIQNEIDNLDLDNVAYENGEYPEMRVGNLIPTVSETDVAPYLFRPSGGSLDIGDRENLKSIVGCTYPFNQLEGINTSWNANRCNVALSDNVYTLTVNSTDYNFIGIYRVNLPKVVVGHKYFVSAKFKPTVSLNYVGITWAQRSKTITNPTVNAWNNVEYVCDSLDNSQFILNIMYNSGDIAENDTHQIKDVMLIDLTAMFGSTIADYIYSLEQSVAGSGVAWFRNLFPKSYYAYNAGTLMSVKTSKHITVGFNQWDGTYTDNTWIDDVNGTVTSKNGYSLTDYIRVIPNTTYYRAITNSVRALFYDADKVLINTGSWALAQAGAGTLVVPSNAHYIRFTIKNDVRDTFCINLSWDGERNGEYEPYVKHEYALDDVELRGIPKLDASNNLYYDGDTYESDGTVTRKYGIANLGDLNWTYQSAQTRFYIELPDAKAPASNDDVANMMCSNYATVSYNNFVGDNKMIALSSSGSLFVRDSSYTDAQTFKTAMQNANAQLVYELATPTTETADSYTELQVVDDFGTEEFVDSREVAIPVGHETEYQPNLRAKVEMSPDLPSSDGKYLLQMSSGSAEYTSYIDPSQQILELNGRCPDPSDAIAEDGAGNYILTCVATEDGENPGNYFVEFKWVKEAT